MDILLHTIALEPARWTPRRVARPLVEWLAAIREAGFEALEIFEPHLALAPDEGALADTLARLGLAPVILSSYLDLSAAADVFAAHAQTLQRRADRFGFRKVRLFPGGSRSPGRTGETIALVAQRLRHLADARPEIEFLLETHDGSLADEPADVVALLERCGRPDVGLLWQATRFDPDAARHQFGWQREHIRHVHLQNRTADGGFVPLAEGVIPWGEFLPDLPESLREAVRESVWAQSLACWIPARQRAHLSRRGRRPGEQRRAVDPVPQRQK